MSRITLAQLRAFESIARVGSFQEAADQLHVTQPTISLRIRDLEAAVGKRLFLRRGTSLKLSDEGRVMLQYVKQGLGLFAEMEERIRTGDPLQGLLRLGASNVFACTCLPPIVSRLERTYPGLKIEITASHSVQLSDMLDANQLDIAFLSQGEQRSLVMVEPLGECDIAWLGGTTNPLKSKTVRPQELLGKNILTASPPSLLSRIIIDWFAAEKIPPPSLNVCNNVLIIAKLVTSGIAMSALPVAMVREEIENGSIIRYEQRVPFKPLRLIAAYQSSAAGPGISAVLKIAHDEVERSGLYRPSA